MTNNTSKNPHISLTWCKPLQITAKIQNILTRAGSYGPPSQFPVEVHKHVIAKIQQLPPVQRRHHGRDKHC